MAKIDISKIARMITEDPDVFLENDNLCESYPMSTDRLVRGNPKDPLVMARQAIHDYGIKIRHAERLGDKEAADNFRNELRKILDDLKYDWQGDPYALELID